MDRADTDKDTSATSSNVYNTKLDATSGHSTGGKKHKSPPQSRRKSSQSSATSYNKDNVTEELVYPKLDFAPQPSAPKIEDITNQSDSGANQLDDSQFRAEENKSSVHLQDSEQNPPLDPKTGKLQLGRYRNMDMLSAIDRLTSIPYQIKQLLWPSVKIAGRALMTRQELSVKSLFADINPRLSEEERALIKQKEQEKQNERQQRSWATQIMYFIFVGIPSALLVGLIYGLLSFAGNLLKDLYTVLSSSTTLVRQAKSDIQYFHNHPEKMPNQDQAVNAITDQVVMPYARTLIQKKLGPVGFMARPADFILNRVIKTGARNASKIITWVSGIPAVQTAATQVKQKVSQAAAGQKNKKREL